MKFLVLLFLSGCATTAPQTKALLNDIPKVAPRVTIENVKFVDQTKGQCGPASLTMAMNWAGRTVEVEQIAPMVMTPKKNGSLEEDLISACRREGLLGITLEGMSSLVKELDAGHPVIIFENLGLSWYQQWHYAIVIGYDLQKEEFILHSGHDAFAHIDMKVFERSWKLSDYWALVVLPAGTLSAAGGELANMQAAAGLEKAGHDHEAQISYQAVLKRWPESMSALIGMANLAYKQKDFKSAVSYLREAKKLYPHSDIVAHNLQIVEKAYFIE